MTQRIEELKEIISSSYKAYAKAVDELYELDEAEAERVLAYVEEMGGV